MTPDFQAALSSREAWIDTETKRVTGQNNGVVPPLWVYSPNSHPHSIEWRMGGGEEYAMVFDAWWEAQNLTEVERIAFFRKFPPPPRWLEWMIEAIWEVEGWGDEDAYAPYFEKVEALGFDSKADSKRDMNGVLPLFDE